MRVLVTGAGGQLGRDVVLSCESAGDDVTAVTHAELDVCSRDAVLGAITALRPQTVINCAAWTAVDACESDTDRAWLSNALSVRWLAEACRNAGAHLTTISTDYVFDGTKATPYAEWDQPNPRSSYGRSKLGGESEASAAGIGAAVVRTSWVCGQFGNNMVKTVMRFANERPELSFVDDQIGHPTFCADLAPVLRRIAVDRRSGIHHLTNQGVASWYEFVQEIVEAMGKSREMVLPIKTADLQPPRPAPRPANSVLDNAAWRLAGMPTLRDYREPLAELVSALS